MKDPSDHIEDIKALVAGELRRQDFGEDFGFAVTWAVVGTPEGPMIGWSVMMTLRNPLLGQPRLCQFGQLASPSMPPDEQIRKIVSDGVAALRQAAEDAEHPPKTPRGQVPAGFIRGRG